MRRFDPEAIKAQIAHLVAEREHINQAIGSLEAALRSIEGLEPQQQVFSITLKESDTTLYDAVQAACVRMIDGIHRKRVMAAIVREYPMLRPKSSSVSAALIKLTKGNHSMLHIASEGQGRTPSYYTTNPENITVRLSADEISLLTDEKAMKGPGGWQSLWVALLKQFDKATGNITLTPELRARIYKYYHWGEGGWQSKIARIFRREFPHLFA